MTPSASAAPNVDCSDLGDRTLCNAMADAALTAVAAHGLAVTTVWLLSGALCSVSPDCLFDPNATFPVAMAPEGGRWVGSAEVAFVGTDEHAGVSLAQIGDEILPELIGYRVPPLNWCSGVCPSSATTDGQFRLELVMPRTTWHTADPISGWADLSVEGDQPTTIAASSQAVITFVYEEVGGDQTISYPISADCKSYTLDPTTPIGERLRMSALPSAKDAHLAPGTWNVRAVAEFTGGPDAVASPFGLLDLCRSQQHDLRTALSITVLQ